MKYTHYKYNTKYTFRDKIFLIVTRVGPVTDRDKKTGAKILKLWINFAQTGNPTPKQDHDEHLGDPLNGFVWEPTTKHTHKLVK